ncbi:MAG: RNA 2',3'-cyclic phosphodiesterase [Bacteroidales bacterium]|nr:RNA 2',3'-cyclic phosphodiesterase [Bacteroidales bacterium]
MTDLLRTFVAVKIKPAPLLLQAFINLKKELSCEPVKWVEPNNLHLTLKFLGDTFPSQVDEIGEELNQVSKQFSSFSFELEGLGYFKNKGMPRVLFANIKDGEVLQLVAAEINNRLVKLGFEPENRPFKPHLTLARIKFLKNKKAFYQAVEKYSETLFQSVNIDELIFYRSILRPEGPEYIPLNIYKL